MARFYGSLAGRARTVATREGNAETGVQAHIRGWDVGVRVEARVYCGRDIVNVTLTGGSNGSCRERFLGYVERGPDGLVWHSGEE